MSNYPPLRLASLNALADLKNQMRANPEFLSDPDCPYDNETKELLGELLTRETVEVIVEKEIRVEAAAGRGRPSKDIKLSAEDMDTVKQGILTTLGELDEMAGAQGLETSEKIQIAKTRTALMDQLLKMQERHSSIQKMGQFVEDIIRILDDISDEAQREQMLKRLESYR